MSDGTNEGLTIAAPNLASEAAADVAAVVAAEGNSIESHPQNYDPDLENLQAVLRVDSTGY